MKLLDFMNRHKLLTALVLFVAITALAGYWGKGGADIGGNTDSSYQTGDETVPVDAPAPIETSEATLAPEETFDSRADEAETTEASTPY